MTVYSHETALPEGKRGVCLGNFDGVHRGHRMLIEKLLEKSAEAGIPSMIYTFKEHPLKVLLPQKSGFILTPNAEKIRRMEELGVEELYLEDFTGEYGKMSPESFVRDILRDRLNASFVVVGTNYSFGAGGRGTPEMLRKLCAEYGIETVILSEIMTELDGRETVISSSVLRRLLDAGRVSDYWKLAGTPFNMTGTVAEGRHEGRKLGFPTANILPEEGRKIPKAGVYAVNVTTELCTYRGITNVGTAPTFGEGIPVTAETYIIGFDGNLYGREISVDFLRFIRGETEFSSVDELRKQIGKDIHERLLMNV